MPGLGGKPFVPGGGNILGVDGLERKEGAGNSQVVPQPAGQSLLVEGRHLWRDQCQQLGSRSTGSACGSRLTESGLDMDKTGE